MRTIREPALFLAQFVGDAAPFNDWRSITAWAADGGYVGVQVPSWDARLFDLDKAAASKGYCDEIKGIASESGIVITELSTHLQGQLVAVHPAYDTAFDGFAAPAVRGKPAARAEWAVDQVKKALTASRNLGPTAHATFSGALAWPYLYPWPQRPAGLVEEAFGELARRSTPILNHADAMGVDVCHEIHPGEDMHDGASFEMFLDAVNGHSPACMLYDPSPYVLQHLDYLDNIDIYHDRIRMFHVKVALVEPDRAAGCLWRIPTLGQPRRPVPQPRRRAGRLWRNLLETDGAWVRRLGRGRMGMLPETPRGWRPRAGGVRQRPPDPRHRTRL